MTLCAIPVWEVEFEKRRLMSALDVQDCSLGLAAHRGACAPRVLQAIGLCVGYLAKAPAVKYCNYVDVIGTASVRV